MMKKTTSGKWAIRVVLIEGGDRIKIELSRRLARELPAGSHTYDLISCR